MQVSRPLKVLLLAGGLCLPLTMQVAADEEEPSRRVARLGDLQRPVSFAPAGTKNWLDVEADPPLSLVDRSWADVDSRAALRLGFPAFRRARRSGFTLLNLTNDAVQAQLTAGATAVHLKDLDDTEALEIEAPNLPLGLLRPGEYRVGYEGRAHIAPAPMRRSENEVLGWPRAFPARGHQRAPFRGTELDAIPDKIDDTGDFERGAQERDVRESDTMAARYASRWLVGGTELPMHDESIRPMTNPKSFASSEQNTNAPYAEHPSAPQTSAPVLPDRPPSAPHATPSIATDHSPQARRKSTLGNAGDIPPADLTDKLPHAEHLDRVHQRQTERLLQRQDQQNQRLEQKHQVKVFRGGQPGETPQLEREHQKLAARQELRRAQLTRKQLQERSNLLIIEKAKKKSAPKSSEDGPPKP